jgi:hypothetical protein
MTNIAIQNTVRRDDERRSLARIPVECNALLRLAEYLTFRARLMNISLDAAQVLCDARYALLIHPGGSDAPPDPQRLIDVSIAMPGATEVLDFKARCRVKYCAPHDEQHMVLGLQFVAMDIHSIQRLDRFVEAQNPVDGAGGAAAKP